MVQGQSTNKTAQRSAKVFTAEEQAAMREHAREVKAAAGRGAQGKADGERDVLEKIAEMPERDRVLAERLHDLIKATAPELTTRTWYGMPAYAKNDKIVCYFQSAHKFKSRYATLGFSDKANLDDGDFWPTVFAVKELTPATEARIGELVQRAVS